ncbi:MAG: 4-hydroxythreonine-4-phosphate dehydrogenase PdxA [Eubacteriales bacterium]|nr:4-hydroxythreonine-4-phosphate dehydrogenase PdxA [Clostridiales bacterium]MDD4140655.1 4-hydroxythreonine-4-phosphate dehydrogenase PdxA [Eubacteriales bacterium]
MQHETSLPVIAIPMGDPNGIGPEIVIKALAEPQVFTWCRPVVVGDAYCLGQTLASLGLPLYLHTISTIADARFQPGFIDLLDQSHEGLENLQIGTVQALAGQCAMDYIARTVSLAVSGEATAIATTPINKESLRAAGVPHIGHTEILADLTGTDDPLTLFETNGLRVFFLSRHVSLRKACDLVTHDRVAKMIRRCCASLQQLGVLDKDLAVAGLNPHSGEHGLFGDEEMTAVGPAVADCQAEGLPVTGPVSADSVFHLARIGRFSGVLSLYHDQGHIATKTLDFERTISLTLGLPFLRTSVDHGTALDIAGQGIASAVSMIEAIRLAAKYAPLYRPLP